MIGNEIISLVLIVLLTGCYGSQPPNIVFIMVDDLGFNDIGYKNTSDIITPTLTQLATKHGVRLENYYTGPTCGPTRSQFLSGRYTIHLGLQGSNLSPCTNQALDSALDTVGDKMKHAGYDTHLIGKWHAGFQTEAHFPTNRGFDTFRGFLLAAQSTHFVKKSKYNGKLYYDYHDVTSGKRTSPYRGDDNIYSTTAFTNRAVELINGHNTTKPMFMYLAYQAPHTPVQSTRPDKYGSQYKGIPVSDRKLMASMVSSIDEGVEQVVAALKKNGNMYDNTYIIFTSDNGGSNSVGSSTYPLKGQKGSYYEGGIRNIGFVHSPMLKVDENTQRSSLVHVTDWMPTLMHIATGKAVNGEALGLDGVDQFATITTGTQSRTKILHTILNRQNNDRPTLNTKNTASMVKVYKGENYKILTGRHAGVNYPNPKEDYTAWDNFRQKSNNRVVSWNVQLYNLSQDPSETTNLSGDSKYSWILNDLLRELRVYERSAMDPIKSKQYGSTGTDQCNPSKHGNVFSAYM